MNQRSGFTLIELLVVITVGGVLTTLAMSLVQQMMFHSRESRELREYDRGNEQLISDLHRDTHSATSVRIGDDGKLNFATSDASTVYSIEATTVTRTVKQDGEISRELYRLAPRQTCQWKVLPNPDRVQFTIDSSSAITHAPAIPLRRLLATVGRFQTKNSSDEATQ